jgi:thiosulfate/3-mercaptopyruvate sulfurtransferase
MQIIKIINPLVSAHWLYKNLNAKNLVVINASIIKVANTTETSNSKTQIPSARFFDIKNKFSDTESEFPNTFPLAKQFTIEAQKLGINKESAIVVYDDKGIYSSTRAWLLFKAFGHENVAVLNGGFPEWLQAEFETETKQKNFTNQGDFIAKLQPHYFKFFEDIKKVEQNSDCKILDARSEKRFKSLVPEPRKGLRSGNIPNSINLPYTKLLNGNCLKSKAELIRIFNTLVKHDQHLVFSCGSGITACVLALASEVIGIKNYSVYDGSWTEYGNLIVK